MVPPLSMGAGHCEHPKLIRKAVTEGMTLVETAREYLNEFSEQVIGQAIAGLDRSKLLLLTKLEGFPRSKTNVIEEVNQSLRALGTDYLDIFLLHNVSDPEILANEEVKESLQLLKQSGKIRYSGVSTHDLVPITRYAIKDQSYDVLMVCFNCLSPDDHAELLTAARDTGIGVIGMKTLPGVDSVDASVQKYFAPSLRYAVSRTFLDTSVVSITNYMHLEQNLGAINNAYDDEDEKVLSRLNERVGHLYCRSCHECAGNCPERYHIPNVMRCLKYFEAYRDPGFSGVQAGRLARLGIPGKCRDCARCEVKCRFGIDIRARMLRAHSLFNSVG